MKLLELLHLALLKRVEIDDLQREGYPLDSPVAKAAAREEVRAADAYEAELRRIIREEIAEYGARN